MRAFAVTVVVLAVIGGCSGEKPSKPAATAKKVVRVPEPGELYMLTSSASAFKTWEAIMEYRDLSSEPRTEEGPSPSMGFLASNSSGLPTGSRFRIVDTMPTKTKYTLWQVLVISDLTDSNIKRLSGKDLTDQVVWIDAPDAVLTKE